MHGVLCIDYPAPDIAWACVRDGRGVAHSGLSHRPPAILDFPGRAACFHRLDDTQQPQKSSPQRRRSTCHVRCAETPTRWLKLTFHSARRVTIRHDTLYGRKTLSMQFRVKEIYKSSRKLTEENDSNWRWACWDMNPTRHIATWRHESRHDMLCGHVTWREKWNLSITGHSYGQGNPNRRSNKVSGSWLWRNQPKFSL